MTPVAECTVSNSVGITDGYTRDIQRIQSIETVPEILDVVSKVTGMGFAAVARVSEPRWICCAIPDEISFGLVPVIWASPPRLLRRPTRSSSSFQSAMREFE